MKTHTFLANDGKSGRHKRKYKVCMDHHLEGYCDLPEKPATYGIYVDPWLRGRAHLIACLHEAVHACLPKMPEAWVDWLSTEVGKFVWRARYRRMRR